MGLEAFDEQTFTEQMDHIEVTGARELTFHFRDGHTDIRHWVKKMASSLLADGRTYASGIYSEKTGKKSFLSVVSKPATVMSALG